AANGSIVLDRRGANGAGRQWLEATADRLAAQSHQALIVEALPVSPPEETGLGYYLTRADGFGEVDREGAVDLAAGSIAATFRSFDARTFQQPPGEWQPTASSDKKTWFAGSGAPLIGDLIHAGVAGVAGQVGEPYLLGAVRPQVLFPAYLA